MSGPRAERPTSLLLGGIQQLSTDPSTNPPVNQPLKNHTLIIVLAASITSIILGYEIGVLNDTMATIKKDLELSDKHGEILTLILHLVALLGSLLAGWTADRIGRKYTIIGVGVIFSIAPLVIGLASSYLSIFLGRVVAHIGVGYTLTVAPIYAAEVSPVFSRGLFTSLPEVFVNLGILLGNSTNYLFFNLKFDGWQLMICQGAISLILLVVAVLIMPESPQWLIMQRRVDEGLGVLAMTSDSKEEAEHRCTHIMQAAGIRRGRNGDVVNVQSTERDIWWDLRQPASPVYHMMCCAITIQVARQFSGFDFIMLYSPKIFEKVGIVTSNKKLLCTIALDAMKTTLTTITAFLLDRHGRRKLLLRSTCVMTISLFSLGMCLMCLDRGGEKHGWASRICMASLIGYVGSFSMGMGAVSSVYNSELFPLTRRAQGCAIAYAANQAASALISLAFLVLNGATNLGGAAIFFAVAMLVAFVTLFIIMPDTCCRTLEEMSQYFGELTKWTSVEKDIEARRSAARQLEMQRSD